MAELASVVGTSLRNNGKTLYDNIFGATPGMFWMKEHGRFKPYNGGLGITEDVEMALNDTVDWRDPKAQIPISEQDPIRQVLWKPVSVDGAIPIYRADERKNAQRIIDFATSLIKNLEKTLKQKVGQAFFADGSPATEMSGLEAIVSKTNSYGLMLDAAEAWVALDRSVYTWWQAGYVDATASAFVINGAAANPGMRQLVDGCKVSNTDEVDVIITTKTFWEYYNGLLLASQRFENPKLAEAGFRNLMFDNAAVVWDSNCTASTMYALTTEYLTVRVDQPCADGVFMTERQPMTADGRLGDVILAIWDGQMTCTVPRTQGKRSGWTAPAP